MEEIWKDIDGFEGLYQISNLGNVKSLNYAKRKYAKVLVPKCNNRGRLWVELTHSGKKRQMLVHRLVAIAFIDNPNNYPQINHIDENPKNNRVENLEWCTAQYNVQTYINNHPERPKHHPERLKHYPGYKPRSPYKYKQKVVQYSTNGEELNRYDNIATVCKINKWKTSSLIECCNGTRKTAYGYIWRFVS